MRELEVWTHNFDVALQTRGHLPQAIELIEETAERVRKRMRAVSLKLLIESLRLRVQNDRKGAETLASRARRVVEELVLPKRTKEIDGIVAM